MQSQWRNTYRTYLWPLTVAEQHSSSGHPACMATNFLVVKVLCASIQLGRWVKSVEVGLVRSWIVTSGRITHSNFFDTSSKHKLLNRMSKSKSRTAALDTKLSIADGNISKVSQYQAHLNIYISRNCNRHKYHILPEGTPKQYTLCGFSRVEKNR